MSLGYTIDISINKYHNLSVYFFIFLSEKDIFVLKLNKTCIRYDNNPVTVS